MTEVGEKGMVQYRRHSLSLIVNFVGITVCNVLFVRSEFIIN